MTSTQSQAASDEALKQLLSERIAQLESGEAERTKTADELAADDALAGATAVVHAVVADAATADEKLRVLQPMYADCVANVRALEYNLGLEEKRLSVVELDYGDLGDDLRKINLLTDKLKTLSRELSKQNKAIVEESERRTVEERVKREEIVAKFDEAMQDINVKLSSQERSVDHRDELVESLEARLRDLQGQYAEREQLYEEQHALGMANGLEYDRKFALSEAEKACAADEEALAKERRVFRDLEQNVELLHKRVDTNQGRLVKCEERAGRQNEDSEKQSLDLRRLSQSALDLEKTRNSLLREEEKLRAKYLEVSDDVKELGTELEFWKGKARSEREKRETQERLCRTLTEERTVMRREVQAMQAAWVLLETEIEKLRSEISAQPDA